MGQLASVCLSWWETCRNCRISVKAISVLGSTGSIGTQTLQIAEEFPDQFRVVALTAGRNLDLLVEQIQRHQPELVALADAERLPELQQRLDALDPSQKPSQPPQLVGGPDGLNVAASWDTADLVVTGIVGCAGLLPTLAAVRAGKDLALANKETLIAAGPVVLPELKKSGSRLLPTTSAAVGMDTMPARVDLDAVVDVEESAPTVCARVEGEDRASCHILAGALYQCPQRLRSGRTPRRGARRSVRRRRRE